MKNTAILLGVTLLFTCCEEDPDPNSGESKTAVSLRALPGMQVFPYGTQMGVYKVSGTSGNRSYILLDSLIFQPLSENEDVNEASFVFHGQHPVTLRIEPTANPQISLPLKYQSPFDNNSVEFIVQRPESGHINLRYIPNFWIDFALFTEKRTSEIPGSGTFQVGNQFNRFITVSLYNDRQQLGDTVVEETAENYLGMNEVFPIMLIGGANNGADSLLRTIEFEDLTAHDTTYVFYDYDKDSLYTERK